MDMPIPAPKRFRRTHGSLRLPVGTPVLLDAAGAGPRAGHVRRWLLDLLWPGRNEAPAGGCSTSPAIRLGITAVPAIGAHRGGAFATPLGCEQGYVLEITAAGVVLVACSTHGLQNGAATLSQLAVHDGTDRVFPCCHIEDWPDLPFRGGADWLLNAEVNLWGYERGDGIPATLARLKRKVDLAAAHKINLVWFDGFGWSAERTAWYAEFVRELADHARARHLRLAFGGYGGGYGFAYQKSSVYQMPYHGQVFRNRRTYPHGAPYPCVGLPGMPESRLHGTCLTNDALAAAKLGELSEFVRRCRPGLLYIHDLDAGTFAETAAAWSLRCSRCRERWPSDDLTSPDGAAGAYAGWFRRVVAAVNGVPGTDDYLPDRDCEIVFVGPLYGSPQDADATWDDTGAHLAQVSRLLGPAANVSFGIREQVVPDARTGPRVAALVERLAAERTGHGVLVIPFLGGDKYYSDQLVPPSPAFHRYWRGARAVYTPSLGSLAEPMAVVCAAYAWQADAPGAYDPSASREEAIALVQRCRRGTEANPAIYGPGGLLRRACDCLYGPAAGGVMAAFFRLGLDDGLRPVVSPWRFATDAVRALEGASPGSAAGHGAAHWQARLDRTETGRAMVEAALALAAADAPGRDGLEWLAVCLDIGGRICRALVAGWEWRLQHDVAAAERLALAVLDLRRSVDRFDPRASADPFGGNPAVWRSIAARLAALTPTGVTSA